MHPQENEYLNKHLDEIYEPEALLTYWMNLSLLALTTAMLFYHIARLYSNKSNENLAAFIAIALLGTGVIYLAAALFNYISRTNDILKACHHNHHCSVKHLERIALSRKVNIGISLLTIGIELVICYLIFNTIGKY